MFTTKTVIVSVINDLATDQRVQRTCRVLQACNYEVVLVGRKLKQSVSVNHLPFKTKRMKLLFTQGPFFYFFFNTRLFFYLLFSKSHLLYANDLDTLLSNYLVSKLKKQPLIYDSHEVFCEVPELTGSPIKKRIWEKIEAKIIPKLKYCITVNQSIADYFQKKYNTPFHVVRNIPEQLSGFIPKTRTELGFLSDKKIIVMQGAGINIDRGAEELVEAMRYVRDAHLFIIGGGDVFEKLKTMVQDPDLKKNITIINKLPKKELLHYTFNADLGISIDKDTNLNYHYSLPNKLFDYIQAGIPVLASKLPEIEAIIAKYAIGDFISSYEPRHIAQKINEVLLFKSRPEWLNQIKIAQQEYTWEKEQQQLVELINQIE